MRPEFINPFVRSVSHTFKTMLSCTVQRGPLSLAGPQTTLHDISGVIGLSGRAVGSVILSLTTQVALKATSTMLMTEATEIDADVIDAVGELANMIAGAAKAELEELELSVSLPSVVTGANHRVRFHSEVSPICVPFSCAWGSFKLEVGLAQVEATVSGLALAQTG